MKALLASLASLLAVLFSLLGLRQTSTPTLTSPIITAPTLATTTLAIGNTNIIVEIADTDTTRAHGLSDRAALDEKRGMLFVFSTAAYQSFWMKDVHFPLDIIWLDDNWRVIDITTNISPESFPKTYTPRAPARYVLEVNSGFASAHHIAIGAQMVLK